MSDTPLLKVRDLSKFYGKRIGCANVAFELWPGEVLAIVGESGSGKTTLLNCLSTRLMPTTGSVEYHMRDGGYRGGPPQGGPRDGGYRPGPPPGGSRDQDGDRAERAFPYAAPDRRPCPSVRDGSGELGLVGPDPAAAP